MSENTKPNNERPADLAVQDSVGGMARRLLNPAHLRDLAGRSVKTLREQGAEQLWRDIKFRVGLAMHHDDWRHRADIPLRRELKAQRAAHLQGPKISIIVPLYNTPAKLFDEMLQSVVRQTYTNWELVLVDASDADKRLERRLPKAVPGTIVYEPIENGGIALNTTRGLALAHGEYITLLDHDDVLYPNALFEVVQTIQNTGADFVYSDEIVLSADLKELGGYHFKPDFAPDYLRGVNFITHLAVFSRPLLDAAGAYESKEFDGAQDHDLILRLTEKAQRIEHIKKVLYIWRAAAGSTAAGMEAKPYAVAAGERAIDAQLDMHGDAAGAHHLVHSRQPRREAVIPRIHNGAVGEIHPVGGLLGPGEIVTQDVQDMGRAILVEVGVQGVFRTSEVAFDKVFAAADDAFRIALVPAVLAPGDVGHGRRPILGLFDDVDAHGTEAHRRLKHHRQRQIGDVYRFQSRTIDGLMEQARA